MVYISIQINKKEQVRMRIGQAAMKCFERYGLEKTTLDDIAKAVGLNKTSLYYYYKKKKDIFIEAAIREGESFNRYVTAEHIKEKRNRKSDCFLSRIEIELLYECTEYESGIGRIT